MRKLLLMSLLVMPQVLPAVTTGQIDTFEDGTTQNWIVNLLGMGNNPVPPVNVPTGGPAGDDDNYLLLRSTGTTGAGSRLVVLNAFSQWAGDYIAAGVGAIRMDIRNLGTTDLHLRLLFERALNAPPTDLAFSTEAIHLPAGGDWTSVVFPIGPADLTAALGTATAALSETTVLRIYSNEDPGPAEPIAAQLGVDNIEAVVPEPSSVLLLGSGLAIAITRKLRLIRTAERRSD